MVYTSTPYSRKYSHGTKINVLFFADTTGWVPVKIYGREIMMSYMQQLYHNIIVHQINQRGCGHHVKKA